MNLLKNLMGVASLALCSFMLSCSSSNDDGPAAQQAGSSPSGNGEVTVTMKQASLIGVVKDVLGNGISGVVATSGTSSATTDANGNFTFDNIGVVNGRTVVSLKKAGYFDVTRSVAVADADRWEVTMVASTPSDIVAVSAHNASAAATLKTTAGMTVALPANGYKVDATGEEYTGNVNAAMLYLDPSDANFSSMMPGGDLAAVRADNSEAQLISYGMIQVNLTDDSGRKLQLKDGTQADLTFPIPENMKSNTPAEIPLWSFNDATGLWEEEGVARLQGDVYVGSVKHFSWANLDYPEQRVTLTGTVKDATGRTLPNVPVQIDQICAFSDTNGKFSVFIPSNTPVKVWVKSINYSNYDPEVVINVPGQSGGSTYHVNIVLPAVDHIAGRVVNKSDGSNLATIWLSYNGKTTKAVTNNLDGTFDILSPAGYTGPATVNVRTAAGNIVTKDINITGGDLNIGDILIDTSMQEGNGGMLTYILEGETKTVNLDFNGSSFAFLNGSGCSVNLIDDRLTIIMDKEKPGGNGWENFMITIENYTPGVTEYTADFNYRNEGSDVYISLSGQINSKVNIVNGRLNLEMSGTSYIKGYIQAEEKQLNGTCATTVALSTDIFIQGKTTRPVNMSELPSYTPIVSTPYPVCMKLTSKYFAGGWILYGSATNAEVLNIINTLKSQGFTLNDGYDGELTASKSRWQGSLSSSDKFVGIEWRDPSYDPTGSSMGGGTPWQDDGTSKAENISAPFVVTILDKPTFDTTKL